LAGHTLRPVKPTNLTLQQQLIFERAALHGEIHIPGDKSISHRALIIGAALEDSLAVANLNTGSDVLATVNALRTLGADVELARNFTLIRPTQLCDATESLNCRNSASTARMVLGLCAGANLRARFDGDRSLRSRTMEPVAAQLRAFGARIETEDGHLPATIAGTPHVQTRSFILLSPSAQIKSALIFAALYAQTGITISNDAGSRDHTERLLQALGASISFDRHGIEYRTGPLTATPIKIPGDFSAAAFFVVGASICPGSSIQLRGIGVNPTRTGLLDALVAMGATISLSNYRQWNEEPVADITVQAADLQAASIGSEIAARALDEIPALAVAAACARGTTTIRGVRRLREKESDRLSTIARMLHRAGTPVEVGADTLQITGRPHITAPPRSVVETDGDHRIAMSAAALASVVGPITVDDAEILDVSFPGFAREWSAAQR